MAKRGVARFKKASHYHKLQSNSHTSLHVGTSLILVLLLVGFLFVVVPRGTDSIAGMAAADGSERGSDYQLEGEERVCSRNLEYVETRWWSNNRFVNSVGVCCDSSRFCASYREDLGNENYGEWQSPEGAYCYSGGSILYEDENWYCARSFEGLSYPLVRCEDSTDGVEFENGNVFCENGRWVTREQCDNNRDDDGDGDIDCVDSDCFAQDVCEAQSCGGNNIVTWSYEYPADEDREDAPSRVGCCAEDQCRRSGNRGCTDQGEFVGQFYCENDQNWYVCNEDLMDQETEDGRYVCNGVRWQLVCSQNQKFEINAENQVCNGERWLSCQEIEAAPHINVKVSCRNQPTVQEYNCNNNEDDDRDGQTDGADDDCQGTLEYELDETRYEVVMKKTDEFSVTLNTE
jgi:hypothetical protein